MSLPADTGSVELLAYRKHVARLLAKGQRPDQRTFAAARVPSVVREVNTRTTTGEKDEDDDEGAHAPTDGLLSSVVYRDGGGTCIACAVHGVFGPPWSQAPDHGRLNVRVTAPFLQDLSAGAGGGFTSAGGHSNAAVANGVSDYPLRQLEGYVRGVLVACLDLSRLVVSPAEACWVLTVSITLLNADGGLRAAALHAAVAALHGLTLPRALLPNGAVVEARPLRMARVPVACSIGILSTGPAAGSSDDGSSATAAGAVGGPTVLLDITSIEEQVVDGVVTAAVDEAGDLVDVEQTGQFPLGPAAVMAIVDQFAGAPAQAIRKRLTNN